MIAGEGRHHIVRRDMRIIACPLCQQAVTPSAMGLKGHFRGKHPNLTFEERRTLEDQLFAVNRKVK